MEETTSGVIIKVTTYDLAGNKATKTIERYVDQSTDKPVIMPVPNTSTTLKYTSMADLEAAMANGSNDNIFVSGGQLQLQIVDDDGIEKIERFMVNGTDETTAKSNITTAMNAAAADENYNPNDGSYDVVKPGNNTTSSISVAFTNYGNHWLKFRVTDKYGFGIPSMLGTGRFMSEQGLILSDEDEGIRRRAIEALKEIIRFSFIRF